MNWGQSRFKQESLRERLDDVCGWTKHGAHASQQRRHGSGDALDAGAPPNLGFVGTVAACPDSAVALARRRSSRRGKVTNGCLYWALSDGSYSSRWADQVAKPDTRAQLQPVLHEGWLRSLPGPVRDDSNSGSAFHGRQLPVADNLDFARFG